MGITCIELLEFSKTGNVTRTEGSGEVVIHGVRYLGARSTNVNEDGTVNVYSRASREASAQLYEGAKIFRDHPNRDTPGTPRSYADQLGLLRGPFKHLEEGSHGNLHLNPKHPDTDRIAWAAEHSPGSLGLSHNAQGAGVVEGKDCRVESISRVRSVDIVCEAATTKGLYEGRNEGNPVKFTKAMLLEAIATKLPEQAEKLKPLIEAVDETALLAILVDETLESDAKVMKALALVATGGEAPEADPAAAAPAAPVAEGKLEDKRDETSPAVVELQEQLAASKTEIDNLKLRESERERKIEITKLLTESKLPKRVQTAHWLERLHKAENMDEIKAMLEDRKSLAFNQEPYSGGAGGEGENKVENVTAFMTGA